jgi:hypothetical protein
LIILSVRTGWTRTEILNLGMAELAMFRPLFENRS